MLKRYMLLFFFLVLNGIAPAQNKKALSFTQACLFVELEQGTNLSVGDYIFTTDNNTVSATLRAKDFKKKLPVWLFVNEKKLNGVRYTTNSEISFTVDATRLRVGKYSAVVTASAAGYPDTTITIYLTVKPVHQGSLKPG